MFYGNTDQEDAFHEIAMNVTGVAYAGKVKSNRDVS